MKKLMVILTVLILAASFTACADRNTIYERKSPVYLETPEPGNERDWEIIATEVPASPTPEVTEDPYELPFNFTGYAYCVINGTTGEVLLGENADTRNYIASITKVLTVMTALDWLSVSESVYVKKGWLDLLKTDSGIDSYGMREETKWNVGDLVAMALVKSFADAAIVLGKAAEERSGRNFLDLMNEKALFYGMNDSHFDNVVGLDIGNNFFENYSTAADAAKLMAEALKNETVMKVCCGDNVKLSTGSVLQNTSAFLTQKKTGASYTILGGKTGYTKAAGSTFAVAVRSNATGTVYVVSYLHGIGMTVLGNEIHSMLEYLISKETTRG